MNEGTGENDGGTETTVLYADSAYFAACIPSISLSADFTAATLGDHGNVTVMEVSGNYDANNPDGSTNTDPRKEIAKEFYRLHKDEYDFLVIFSNFDFQMPEPDAKAFYLHIKNDKVTMGSDLLIDI